MSPAREPGAPPLCVIDTGRYMLRRPACTTIDPGPDTRSEWRGVSMSQLYAQYVVVQRIKVALSSKTLWVVNTLVGSPDAGVFGGGVLFEAGGGSVSMWSSRKN